MTIERSIKNGFTTIRNGVIGVIEDTKACYNNIDKNDKNLQQRRIVSVALKVIGLIGLTISLCTAAPYVLTFLFKPITTIFILFSASVASFLFYELIVVGNEINKTPNKNLNYYVKDTLLLKNFNNWCTNEIKKERIYQKYKNR